MIIFTNLFGRLSNLSALKDFISVSPNVCVGQPVLISSLKFLATVSGDLSNITAPPFILAPQSTCEFPAYWIERPALFAAPAFEPSPEKRMLLVLQNYLASLQRQYYLGQPNKAGTKKPLNPFLGELFFCECEDPNGKAKVRVISEQVSHHPPTTAASLIDEENGVHVIATLSMSSFSTANSILQAEAYSTQSTSISGTSIVVRQTGHALITVDKYDETYLLPFPDVWAKNVLSGSPYPELDGTYRIISSSGYAAEILFGGKSRKPWSSGVRNGFEASVFHLNDNTKKPCYEVGGCWSESWEIHNAEGKVIETYDLSDPKRAPVPLKVTPLEKQSPWESRRAWRDVAESLKSGDFNVALKAKSKLENGQREMRKREEKEGKVWETLFFTKREVDSDSITEKNEFALMAELMGEELAQKVVGTHGDWRFDPEKEKRWREGHGPSRPETPVG